MVTTAALAGYLDGWHKDRIWRLEGMDGKAREVFWWPFTQHKMVGRTTTIDSAYGDHYLTFEGEGTVGDKTQGEDKEASRPLFDACASWWTQSVGHAHPNITMAAGRAAGRYGHVIFPESVHEPALELAERLLNGVGKGWASRVFFSDDGSTATEVALKMAMRRAEVSRLDYKKDGENVRLEVVGLESSYHGDTIGAMNASAPNIYNGKVNWYTPLGLWFDPPTIAMKDGMHVLRPPSFLPDIPSRTFTTMTEIFDRTRDETDAALLEQYTTAIDKRLDDFIASGRHPGCLVLEPVLMGAGGMLLIDPLFQRALIRSIRKLHTRHPILGPDPLPVIFDEVFVGMHRINPGSRGSVGVEMVGEEPDLAYFAKSLTAGLVPMAVTLASERVFEAFKGDEKAEAFLHGHSYTAHPVGCQVAVEALRMYEGIPKGDRWNPKDVDALSRLPNVSGVVCLGTVLAVELTTATRGYTAAKLSSSIAARLRDNHGVFMRPLGNVLYAMLSHTTPDAVAADVLKAMMEEIGRSASDAGVDGGATQEYVV
ncbi:hypothetical protein HK101_001311 [Irineochytrium annulatum]|nr:hypothetical protein HK101_001311 [Irineochytrium annulatum]